MTEPPFAKLGYTNNLFYKGYSEVVTIYIVVLVLLQTAANILLYCYAIYAGDNCLDMNTHIGVVL